MYLYCLLLIFSYNVLYLILFMIFLYSTQLFCSAIRVVPRPHSILRKAIGWIKYNIWWVIYKITVKMTLIVPFCYILNTYIILYPFVYHLGHLQKVIRATTIETPCKVYRTLIKPNISFRLRIP